MAQTITISELVKLSIFCNERCRLSFSLFCRPLPDSPTYINTGFMRERPHQQVTTGKETLFKMPSHDGFTVVAFWHPDSCSPPVQPSESAHKTVFTDAKTGEDRKTKTILQ